MDPRFAAEHARALRDIPRRWVIEFLVLAGATLLLGTALVGVAIAVVRYL